MGHRKKKEGWESSHQIAYCTAQSMQDAISPCALLASKEKTLLADALMLVLSNPIFFF